MDAERAARRFVEAALAGKPMIVLTPLAWVGARVGARDRGLLLGTTTRTTKGWTEPIGPARRDACIRVISRSEYVMHRSVRILPVVFTAAAAAALALSPTALAADGGRPFHVAMTGAAEAPGPGDPDGSGTAHFRVNPGQEQICYTLEVSGIAPAAAAHIHVAPVGSPGPVVVPLAAPTSGSSSACATVDRDLALAILMHPENYYVNVHNAQFPAGAVRGQLG